MEVLSWDDVALVDAGSAESYAAGYSIGYAAGRTIVVGTAIVTGITAVITLSQALS